MVTIQYHPDNSTQIITVTQAIDDNLMKRLPNEALSKAIDQIVNQVVDKIVSEKFGEILSKVDTLAIANLAIARCASKIADELTKKDTK